MADLLGVLLGGLLAIGGGIATQYWKIAAEAKERRGKKFEEMVAAVYELDHWLDEKRNRLVYGEDRAETPSPYTKLQAISGVHFPQFVGKVKELRVEVAKFGAWMSEKGVERVAGKRDKLNEGFQEVYKSYLNKEDELLDELLAYAEKEFKADDSKLKGWIDWLLCR